MTIEEIISELKEIRIENSEDFNNLDRVDELCDGLTKLPNGALACQTLVELIERHPNIEFGMPGTPVHVLESFDGHYETYLYDSLKRRPTELTVWMLNRIINSKTGNERDELLELLKMSMTNENADEQTRETAKDFLEFQTES